MRRGIPALAALLILAGCATTGGERLPPADLLETREIAEQAYADERYTEALPIYQALAESVPQDAEIWFRLGNIHARLDQPQQAIRAYEETLVRDPGQSKAWHNLGVIHLRNAANAYSQLCANASASDPLCRHAMETLEGLNALIRRRPANPSESTPDQPAAAAEPSHEEGPAIVPEEPIAPSPEPEPEAVPEDATGAPSTSDPDTGAPAP